MEVDPPIGTQVEIVEKGLHGTVAFVGPTEFQAGKWIGVVLDEPKGKNNGNVQGKEYFRCEENCGIFVRPTQVKWTDPLSASTESLTDPSKPKSSGLRAPSVKRPSGIGGEAGGSSTNLTEQDVAAAKEPSVPDSASKIKPPSKMQTPAPMKTSASSEKLKPSPSVEKLTKAAAAAPPPSSPSPAAQKETSAAQPETFKTPAAPVKSLAKTLAKAETTSPPAVTDQNKNISVAQKVAAIHQDLMEKSSASIGIIKVAGIEPGSGVELEYLRSEVMDLKEKLETLRIRRQEDKQKLIEFEKCKIQLEQLTEYRNKIQEAHADLQRQLQQARKEAKEAIEARDQHAEEMSSLAESIEMSALDKEMAEEKADSLQQEVTLLKEKVEELTIELDVLKEEIEQKGMTGVGEGIQSKQLQQQNDRLKEAVMKLRDLSNREKQENQKLTKDIETFRQQIDELTKRNEKLMTENKTHEEQLVELRDQVDAAMGSEEMIERLTERNLSLEERVVKLEETVDDLEQMRAMDEELQETAKETEKEFLREQEMARVKYNELRFALDQSLTNIKDHETTILKFRKHTAQLQDEIQDLKDKLAIQMDRKTGGGDTDAPVFQQLFMQNKAQTDLIENELRKLELEISSQQVRYLRSFLPDSFIKAGGDWDALQLTLLFPRLIAKAELLVSQVRQKFVVPPGGMSRDHVTKSHKSEQWSFAAKFSFQLRSLVTTLDKYQSVLGQCSVERLSRMAQLQPDMTSQERQIDYYLDLLKTNRLDENSSFDSLEKANNFFQNLYSVHLASEEFDRTKYLHDTSRQLVAGLYWFSTDLKRVKQYLLPTEEGGPLWKMIGELQLFTGSAEECCRKIRSRIPSDPKQGILQFPNEVCARVTDVFNQLNKAAHIVHVACASASSLVTLLPDVEGVDSARMEELLHEGSAKVVGRQQEKSCEDILRLCLGIVMAETEKILGALESGEYDAPTPDVKPFPPLLERAHARKQESVDLDSLRWQIDKKDTEIMDLKKALRLKAEEVSEMQVRKEMVEKRLQTTGKEGDERVVKLARKLEEQMQDIKKKEREFEQANDNLQQELDSTEKENFELKERIKILSKKALLQGISAGITPLSSPNITGSPLPSPSSSGVVHDSPLLAQQIATLKAALTKALEDKLNLQAQLMKSDLNSLPPLNVPMKQKGLATHTGLIDLDQMTQKKHDDLSALLRETNRLQKEFVQSVAGVRVVEITKNKKPGEVATLEKQTPSYAFAQQIAQQKKLENWMVELNVRMKQLSVNANVTPFAKFASQQIPPSATCVGRISFATDDVNLAGKTVKVVADDKQLLKLRESLLSV